MTPRRRDNRAAKTDEKMFFRALLTLLLTGVLSATGVEAQRFVVRPYLQTATPTSIWVCWEAASGGEGDVEWGTTSALGERARASWVSSPGGRVYEAHLAGLVPETRYFYRTRNGSLASEIHEFTTPPNASAERSFRFVAMSDMQQDSRNREKFREVVNEGVIPFVRAEYGGEPSAELGMVLIPGDLVDDGNTYREWAETFFGPAAALMAQVPTYPVPGNHERNSAHFFRYFHLPNNGSTGFEEHWWYNDYSNFRVIGLDSNSGFRIDAQLDWLDGVLDEACMAEEIDFVFAQLHHPHRSELWLPGEIDYTGEVIRRLEMFTDACGKPTAHLFGHTHGYSRGQSRDHAHLWINVATAGGNIDYWGEYEQNDYDEFTVTEDEYGFVLVDVEAGDDPSFRVRRVSRGDEAMPRANEVRDDLYVRRYGMAAQTPIALPPSTDPVPTNCRVMHATPFVDADGDTHQASHWQLSLSCEDFSTPLFERWTQSENRYGGEDRQAGDDLTNERASPLMGDTAYCMRVRYRDSALRWSEWSEPAPFRTAADEAGLTENLLTNPGAEDGVMGWTSELGSLESLTAGQCDGREPHSGTRYFAPGGLCDAVDVGRATQLADVASHATDIDAGRAKASFHAWLRTWSGDDRPEARLIFLGAGGEELGTSPSLTSLAILWTLEEAEVPVPAGTRQISYQIIGTRNRGSDNDAYFDDLSLRLRFGEDAVCTPPEPPEPPIPPMPDAGPGTPDASLPDDASMADAASPDAGSGGDGSETGCGCSVPRRSSGIPAWLAVFSLALLWRPRRTTHTSRHDVQR